MEPLESRRLLSINTLTPEETLADLAFRTWAPEGSTALLVEPVSSIATMEYEVSALRNSQAILRGVYSEQEYPDGVDFSCGVTLPLRADSPSVMVTFHDVYGIRRYHHIDDVMAEADTAVYLLPGDFSDLGHIRKIDFTIADDLEAGFMHVGDTGRSEIAPPTETDEPAEGDGSSASQSETTDGANAVETSILSDMSFRVWTPEGSQASVD